MKHIIPYFTGIDEKSGTLAGNAAAARTALNISTDHGRLASSAGYRAFVDAPAPGQVTRLYVHSDEVQEYLVVGTKTCVLAFRGGAWSPIYENASSGDWGFLSYKKEDDDVLLFGNGSDPVQIWDGAALSSMALPGCPAACKFFALHGERVWMCGDGANPDRVYYSRLLDPEDWSGDIEIPERGGGFVEIPTFDGGIITSLYSVGGDLCLLKTTTALLLYGTSPQNYQITEMSGKLGTIAGRTAVVSGQSSYFVAAHGIGVQSGSTLSLLDDRRLPRLFDPTYCEECDPCAEGLSPHFGACAMGALHRERVLFALPTGQNMQNNVLLEYDLTRDVYMMHDGLCVVDMALTGLMREKLLLLTGEGRILIWGEGRGAPAVWVTPWLDFGSHDEKSMLGFALYGSIRHAGRAGGVRVTVYSDRGKKERILEDADAEQRLYKRRFTLSGRRFRVRIEALPGTVFSFTGGLEIETRSL